MGEPPAKHKLKVSRELGTGSFGSVYLGTYDGGQVAVKISTADEGVASSASQDAGGQFFREARILRQCDHSRIIRFKALVRMPPGSGTSKNSRWALVMEYAKHGTLTRKLLAQMTSPTRRLYSTMQALGWAMDLASALEYLHLRSPAVLHRDVKSSNVMLTSEEGCTVAKLSDFGLHVTADESRPRQLQTSHAAMGARRRSGTGAGLASGAATSPSPAGGEDSSHHHDYSEVHDATGSRIFVGGAPLAGGATTGSSGGGAAPAAAAGSSDSGSTAGGHAASAASAAAAAGAPGGSRPSTPPLPPQLSGHSGVQHQLLPPRGGSFRRAGHHPTADALPRVMPVEPAGLQQATAVAEANASLFALWAARDGSIDLGSSCGGSRPGSLGGGSMVTVGTWATGGTGGSMDTGAGSSMCGDGSLVGEGSLEGEGSISCSVHMELETVFSMTGYTGSVLYMAPEVYLHQAYNEKGDVFSFGVVLYELLARTLIMFSELPTGSSDPQSAADGYADKVAGGYRPSQPKSVPDDLWRLISACWHQDPLMRPHMSEVVAALAEARNRELERQLRKPQSRLRELVGGAGGSSSSFAATSAAAGVRSCPLPDLDLACGSTAAAAAAAAAAADDGSVRVPLSAGNIEQQAKGEKQLCGCTIS